MRNIKFAGIHFRKDDESGIAKISITNTTTSTDVITDDLVDLYTADKDATNDEYEDFIYWALLNPDTDAYEIVVEHSGVHNPSAGSPYSIKFIKFLTNEELQESEAECVVQMWHTTWSTVIRDYTLTSNDRIDITEQQTFNGDSSTGIFSLSGDNHADEFIRISVDSGVTWKNPEDFDLTWGSNASDYDDEIITSTGYFSVNLVDPPDAGTSNVIVEYKPLYNKYKVVTTLKQPTDGSTYVDYRFNTRLLDHGIEFIK